MTTAPQPTADPSVDFFSEILGGKLSSMLVLALVDATFDAKHTFVELPVEEAEGVVWLYDEELQTIIAAVFHPSQWTEATARAWLSGEAGITALVRCFAVAMKKHAKPATPDYFRKLIELLTPFVPIDKFRELVNVARAYAGGKAAGAQSDDPVTEDDQDDDPATATEEGSAQSGAAFVVFRPPAFRGTINGNDPNDPYVDETTGWIWKPILRAATVYNAWGEAITIERQTLADIVDSFGKTGIDHVDIPLGHNEERGGDTPDLNTGFVRAVKLSDDGNMLWGALDFTDQAIKTKVMSGTIANVSVWIEFEFADLNEPDKIWPCVLWHVALTNKPQMTGLPPFSRLRQKAGKTIAASRGVFMEKELMAQKFPNGTAVMTTDQEIGLVTGFQDGPFYQLQMMQSAPGDNDSGGEWIPEENLNAYDGTTPAPGASGTTDNGSGAAPASDAGMTAVDPATLTPAQIDAFTRQFGIRPADLQGFKLQQEKLRDKSRKQELSAISAALQGTGKHDLVTQIPGTCHYPAVVAAVQTALREQPAKLSLSVDLDGTVPAFDAAILSVVNALPETARLSLAQPVVPDDATKPVVGENGKKYTREDIEAFNKRLG